MRSRYTAYATGDAGYIQHSWHPDTRPAELYIEPGITWTGLEVIDTERGRQLDADGIVEFVAHHVADGTARELRERSSFVRHEGRWVYVDGR